MEMEYKKVAKESEAAGGQSMQETPAGTIQEPLERGMAQADLPMVKPLKAGTPTGLFDCQGSMLSEGDRIRIANSPVLWTVRFSTENGFVAHMRKDTIEITAPLRRQPRAGKLFRRQWLKDVTRLSGEVCG